MAIPRLTFVLTSMRQLPLLAVLMLLGCQRTLLPTPSLYYAEGAPDPFASVHPENATTTPSIPYVTDRAVKEGEETIRYTYGRSRSLRFGTATVEFGRDDDWAELSRQSRLKSRGRSIPLSIGLIEEQGGFPEMPMPVTVEDGVLTVDAGALKADRVAEAEFQEIVRTALDRSTQKEVLLTVHGINNTFESATMRAAELWHFMGRDKVVIPYSWPAGYPDLFRGYMYDFASSKFTIGHFKRTIRALSQMPEVEKIHILAHSRGCDVAMSAVRELNLRFGEDASVDLKLGHLVLIAADLDWDVVVARSESRSFLLLDRLTIYTSSEDGALSAARFLWKSVARLGEVRMGDLSSTERDLLRVAGTIDIIDVQGLGDGLGHSYFADPAVLSDLVLLLAQDRPPGKENGRPLTPLSPGFWELPEGYPNHGE